MDRVCAFDWVVSEGCPAPLCFLLPVLRLFVLVLVLFLVLFLFLFSSGCVEARGVADRNMGFAEQPARLPMESAPRPSHPSASARRVGWLRRSPVCSSVQLGNRCGSCLPRCTYAQGRSIALRAKRSAADRLPTIRLRRFASATSTACRDCSRREWTATSGRSAPKATRCTPGPFDCADFASAHASSRGCLWEPE